MAMAKLPVSQMIELQSNEDQWGILIRGLINEIKCTALIQRDNQPRAQVNLVIQKIISPDMLKSKTQCTTTTSMGDDVGKGTSRITEFLHDFLDKDRWMLFGYIDGPNQIPILITYYKSISVTIYTQKLISEQLKGFLPDHLIPPNSSMN